MNNQNFPIPQTQAPELSFSLSSGEQWTLSKQNPKSFAMIVFYRGRHCPVCKGYTNTLDNLADEYTDRGIDIVTVSMDTEKKPGLPFRNGELKTLK